MLLKLYSVKYRVQKLQYQKQTEKKQYIYIPHLMKNECAGISINMCHFYLLLRILRRKVC